MHSIQKFDIYIFDCDGVILDSNELKIEAMKNALLAHFSIIPEVDLCIDYFRNNFGKSRFHHINHFLNNILNVEQQQRDRYEKLLLADFSKQCRKLYLNAEITPGFLNFLKLCEGKRYVASGSEQEELRNVFIAKRLDKYFDGIFGSPTPKVELIRHILNKEKNMNAVMFGDAESDMVSACQNDIEFVFYSRYSNVKDKMLKLCALNKFAIIDNF
ncbi:haloacid dehalogenase [Veronia nyctiphanis]|uniref:phosphoglycolate phosphatase n=1 Tax=Veronia nyctiphanis TaxID=1278244 RepID=A0A4Q0YWN1_9GAMM|nr:HAD family hydrolase [Veronia nyctiphanis]RXJ74684.1 haloacid dehalogenase [Veronia nyctiphanis]